MRRREFLSKVWSSAVFAVGSRLSPAITSPVSMMESLKSPFRVSVINDELTQDFGRACEIAACEFGMEWIELRGMWNKNVLHLDANEVREAQRILKQYGLHVTDIASPLFKVDWAGAPKSKFSPKEPSFGADFTFDQQADVLARCIEVAKVFGTDRVRCFDFWRLDDPTPYRKAINEKLLEGANKAGKQGITLVLENEMTCNTATGAEASKVLAAIGSPHLMLNWDPGNAAAAGEKPYPDGYELLPKNRIGHCHCKDVIRPASGKSYEWAAMGNGIIDWVGQFKALKQNGYRMAVSLETHWRGPGTPEASTRQSWVGMKTELQKAGAL
jgi:sugar phosphate isomerase/epimerase